MIAIVASLYGDSLYGVVSSDPLSHMFTHDCCLSMSMPVSVAFLCLCPPCPCPLLSCVYVLRVRVRCLSASCIFPVHVRVRVLRMALSMSVSTVSMFVVSMSIVSMSVSVTCPPVRPRRNSQDPRSSSHAHRRQPRWLVWGAKSEWGRAHRQPAEVVCRRFAAYV